MLSLTILPPTFPALAAVKAFDDANADGPAKEIVARLFALAILDVNGEEYVSLLNASYMAVGAALKVAGDDVKKRAQLVCKTLTAKGFVDASDADKALKAYEQVVGVLSLESLTIPAPVVAAPSGEGVELAKAPKVSAKAKAEAKAIAKLPKVKAQAGASDNPLAQKIAESDGVDVLMADKVAGGIRRGVSGWFQQNAPEVFGEYRKLKDIGDGSLDARRKAYDVLFAKFSALPLALRFKVLGDMLPVLMAVAPDETAKLMAQPIGADATHVALAKLFIAKAYRFANS